MVTGGNKKKYCACLPSPSKGAELEMSY